MLGDVKELVVSVQSTTRKRLTARQVMTFGELLYIIQSDIYV